jgi:hypothetical protein
VRIKCFNAVRAHRLNRTGEFGRRDGHDSIAIAQDFFDLMLAQQKTGRDYDGADFQRTQYRDHRMEIGAEPQHDPVAALYPEATQDIREAIRKSAQLGIRIWAVIEPRRNFGAAARVDVPIDDCPGDIELGRDRKIWP